jgi:hypothetical protein
VVPPSSLGDIQCVKTPGFERYMLQVGALYKQLQRLKDNEEELRKYEHGGLGADLKIPLAAIINELAES